MKRIILLSIFFLFFTSQGFAFTYSLVDDWSNLTNPNGPWSYNEGNNPLQFNINYFPVTEFGSSQTTWTNKGDGPGWFKSIDDPNSIANKGPYDWLKGDIIVHATDSVVGPANISWRSPVSGTYDINGGLWSGREIGRSNDWNFYLDNVLLDTGSLFTGDIYSRSNPDSFNFQGINISEGSVLKLEVLITSLHGDFVGVNFNINESEAAGPAIPEPTTMLLIGSGLMSMLVKRKWQIGNKSI